MFGLFFPLLMTLLFLSAPSNSICANDNLYTLDIAGKTQFIFEKPKHWNMVKPIKPFTYELVKDTGNPKCYLNLSAFDKKVGKKHLTTLMFESIGLLYGDKFWENPNYVHGCYYSELEDSLTWGFVWKTENKIQGVLATTYKAEEHSLACILVVSEFDKSTFNANAYTTSLINAYTVMLTHLDCIEKN